MSLLPKAALQGGGLLVLAILLALSAPDQGRAQIAPPAGGTVQQGGAAPGQGSRTRGASEIEAADSELSGAQVEAQSQAARDAGRQGQQAQGQGGQNQQSGQQNGKQGPAQERISPLTPLGMSQKAWDHPVAAPGQIAPGTRLYYWEPGKVYMIRARTLQSTTIYLPKCEQIISLGAADSTTFYIAWARMPSSGVPAPLPLDQINVQPKCTDCDNNIQVTGESGRTYPFHIDARAINADQVTDLQVMVEDPSFCPERSSSVRVDPALSAGGSHASSSGGVGQGGAKPYGQPAEPLVRAEMPVAGDLPADNLIDWHRYEVVAKSKLSWQRIAPSRVGYDGRHIYLDYSHQAAVHFPSVREVRDNVESSVPFAVIGERHDILRVTARTDLILRTGEDIVCLFQKLGSPAPGQTVRVDDDLSPPEEGGGR